MRHGQSTYHLSTLSFRDKTLEQSFKDYYFRVTEKHGRWCHIIAILFCSGDGIRDFFLFQDYLPRLLFIRYGVVVSMFAMGLIFSFLRPVLYKKIWQPLFAFYFLVTGIAALNIALIIPEPYGPNLHVTLLYCMVFGYTFIRLRFIWASLAGLTLTTAYLAAVLGWKHYEPGILWIQMPFVVGVNLLGMFVAYTIEFIFRQHFRLQEKYKEQNVELDRMNKNLEQRVEARTKELAATNRSLIQNMADLKSSETERFKLESQLRQAYKMEAIGTLAGGIAHDFNNILSSILGFTELAMDDARDQENITDSLNEVHNAGTRAKDLVRQILAFARQSEEERKPIQVGPIAREVLKLLRSSLPSNIDIVSDIQNQWFITGDPINVHQILMNLCTNAGHAMKNGGRLDIGLMDMAVTEDVASQSGTMTPGDYVVLRVSDTGKGIPSNILHSIFEPYFTTKEPGEGTGMGLAMVYGIVKNYGGDIRVDSEPGKGASFTVYFPAERRGKKQKSYEPEPLPGGTERILFVDDEPAIARMSTQMLERLGYTVTSRVSSMEALELFKAKPRAFDLVITDMMMPQMTGDRLASKIMMIRPDIPVILCTGYSRTLTPKTASALRIKALVNKPVIKADLARTVRKVLDREQAI